ncbi:MAG: hypothetical protein J7L91_02865 [Candidatus Korarchaeota archaeon]|nr:hypothetical protein [Candidatus Korarchaeota archaeon]
MPKYRLFFLLMALLLILPYFAYPLRAAPDEKELKFELLVLSWDDLSVTAGEVIANQLKKVGIKVTVTPLDDSVMYPRLEKRQYEAEEMSYGVDPAPLYVYNRFHSSQDFEGGSNEWSYHNPEVDKLLDEAFSTGDREKAKQILYKVQEILTEDVPYIPLFLAKDVHPFAKGWTNWTIMPAGPISPYNKLTPIYIYNTEGKDTMVIRYPSAPEPLSPMAADNGRALYYNSLVYDTLVAYDKNLKPIPWLAEKWELSEDGKTLTFHLRKGVKWHDGQPLTSEDVAFTFNYIKKEEVTGGIYTPQIIKYLDSVETPDDYTVVVHLKSPFPFAVDAFGYTFIVPKHIWKDIDKYDWPASKAKEYAVGSGPFKFVKYVEGEYLELVRNDDWWGKKPNVKRILLKIIKEDESAILQIKKGEVTTLRYGLMSPALVKAVKEDPNVQVVEAVDQWDYLLAFNNKKWPFNIKEVRQAIAYAINKEEIVEKILGLGWISETYVFKSWYSDWSNPNVKKYDYNPEKAKQLLEKAGFRDIDGDGILEYAPQTETTTTKTTKTTTPATTSKPPTTTTQPVTTTTPPPAGPNMALIGGIIIVVIVIIILVALFLRRR